MTEDNPKYEPLKICFIIPEDTIEEIQLLCVLIQAMDKLEKEAHGRALDYLSSRYGGKP